MLKQNLEHLKLELERTEKQLIEANHMVATLTQKLEQCEAQLQATKVSLAAAESKLEACEEAKHKLDLELARSSAWITFLTIVGVVLAVLFLAALVWALLNAISFANKTAKLRAA